MKDLVIRIFIISSLLCNSFGANILVLEEIATGSHHSWMKTISYGLAARGHNVTSLSAFIEEDSPVHYLQIDKMKRFEFMTVNIVPPLRKALGPGTFAVELCQYATESNGWQQLLNYPNNFNFDLIIYDHIFGACQLAFAQKFNFPPIVGTSSGKDITLALIQMGYPLVPSINTFYAMNHFVDGLMDSIYNYIVQIEHYVLNEYYFQPKMDDMVRKTMPNITAVHSLHKKMRLLFLNNHPVKEKLLYPTNVIDVSGLHIDNVKPLQKDMEDVMNSAIDGVILFSIGSSLRAELIDTIILQQIISSFQALPNYNIIWHFNGPMTVPKNVFTYKWLPLNDILGHPKTKLFISHCGLLSIQEATYHGVPILGVPIANDQFLNCELLVKSGVAEQILLKDLTSTLFSEKIHKILNTSNIYYENMKKLSKSFRDQKDEPLERAMWWAEWLIRNPNEMFVHDPIQNLNFIQRQSLDVLFILQIIVIFVTLFVSLILCKCCCGIVRKSKNESPIKNKIN